MFGKIIKLNKSNYMELISRVIALLMISLLIPIFILLSIIIFLFEGNPIFYKQIRHGYKFKKFQILKFRTMIENNGKSITTENDHRITKVGHVLRKYKLDELPQLINILIGDMRFIGPRPESITYFNENEFYFLKNIKPGLSDYASIIFHNEEKILSQIGGENPYSELLPIKLSLASYYEKRKNFLEDFKLVLYTITVLFFSRQVIKYFMLPELKRSIPDLDLFISKYKIFN